MMEYPDSQSERVSGVPLGLLFAVFALLVSVNLIYLDILVFGQPKKTTESSSVVTLQPTPAMLSNQECPQSCLTQIQESLTNPISKISPAPSKNTPTPEKTSSAGVKEYFIPFGSGSGNSTEWQDVSGLAASIDTANYTNLKTVTFEATLRIPTGNQTLWVRLFNTTGKHPVWFSDISVDGGATKLVVSPSVTLDQGNNLYQVQMKTSLGYLSHIDQSRLRMVTQ